MLGRVDITAFLGRLSFLNERGDIFDCTQYMTVRDTRRVLTRLRTLGRAKPGQPLHGLADDFALRQEDIPDDPEDSEAGRDLPAEVMRQLCANLDALETVSSTDVRTAIELLIDTGRRPNAICKLPWQCLDRESDGSPVLVYDNTKNLRHARRLPIPGRQAQALPHHPGQPPRHEGDNLRVGVSTAPSLGEEPAPLPGPHRDRRRRQPGHHHAVRPARQESGLGGSADIDQLQRRITLLEQDLAAIRGQLDERTEELDAARAADRELTRALNQAR
ncbi:hypothetical protein WB401_24755 [Streptomyces brasiliscabiei]|uniref:Integrase n=1 Tax=Streptomyces brasiliscabiei TaxID=2736302 RepID=A0ABU8GCZ3_9ACTN